MRAGDLEIRYEFQENEGQIPTFSTAICSAENIKRETDRQPSSNPATGIVIGNNAFPAFVLWGSMSTIRGLLERAEPGNRIRWYAENGARQRAPSTVTKIVLEERHTVVELEDSRGGEYTITVPDQREPFVSRTTPEGDEEHYGGLEWISVVAGGEFHNNTLCSNSPE
ncbi:hypothetical protein GCM10027355_01210 [Haloplanus salinarum]